MDIFTHTLMGTLPCFLLLGKISPEAIILLWIMAIFPDADIFVEPFTKKWSLYYLSHKAASHSYIIGIIITGIVSVPLSLLRVVPFIEIWIAGAIGYSIHITLDFFGASKVPIFYPFSKKEFRIIADRAINPLLGLFSGINLLILLGYYFISPYYHVFMELASFYLIVYFAYFGTRLMLRLIIQLLLPKGSHYIPGFIPFFYLIYTQNSSEENIKFNLDKKFAFSLKKKALLQKSILKNSPEMTFFQKTKEIGSEYRFFHKWNAIIPFIQENEKSIKVVLILAESYSRMSSYFLSVVFDKNTKQVISKSESFGHFKKWKIQGFNS